MGAVFLGSLLISTQFSVLCRVVVVVAAVAAVVAAAAATRWSLG